MLAKDDAKLVKQQNFILYVEDERIVQHITIKLLGDLNCKVDLANNGLEAAGYYFLKKYDLILLDCELPDIQGISGKLNGIELSRRIRKYEENLAITQTPIVMLTANLKSELQEECNLIGINRLADKPVFEKEEMRKLLSPWLKCQE